MQDYLFDSKQLTDGAPPNDRGCRFCGKIGHIQKDCPKKKINTEKRDKKERQKDHRDISRLAGVENGRDESRVQADCGVREETKANPEREEKKTEQKVTALTAKGAGPSSIAREGNSDFDIPLKMMIEHCKKWESNPQYKAEGEKLLGMRRHGDAAFDVGKLEKGTVVCHVPSESKEKFMWTIDFEKAKRNIPDRKSYGINSCYGYIFKTVEVMSRNLKQTDGCNTTRESANVELPDNIGESLLQKMKEVSDQRKQKKKERMKVRYRREMAGPGYKRGKKFEINNSKGSNRPATFEPYASPKKHNYGHCKAYGENFMSPGVIQRTGMSNITSAQSLSKPYRGACSSSEDDSFPTREVRRKGKTKNNPENSTSAHDRVNNANRNLDKCIGEVRSRIFFSREGAIKAKHQPSLKLTHKFIAISSDKEVVTVSSNSPMSNLEKAEGLTTDQQNILLVQPTLTSARGNSSAASVKETAESCTLPSTPGASGGAQTHRARHKPRSRKGKRGGAAFKPNGGVNENVSSKNPE